MHLPGIGQPWLGLDTCSVYRSDDLVAKYRLRHHTVVINVTS